MGIVARQSIKGSLANYLGVAIGFFTTFFVVTKCLTQEEIGLTRVLVDAATLFAQALAATRQLAKRQLTWQRQFRERWAGLTGFDFRRDDLPAALAAHAARFLETA